jgi:hypothetical protein
MAGVPIDRNPIAVQRELRAAGDQAEVESAAMLVETILAEPARIASSAGLPPIRRAASSQILGHGFDFRQSGSL